VTTPAHQFAVSTARTGPRHAITVTVMATMDALRAYTAEHHPHVSWDGQNGLFVQPGYYWNNPPEIMGEIMLTADHINTHTIAHEAVHAACAIYHADILGPHSRAAAHLKSDNEILAYLVDDLVEQIMDSCFQAGVFNQGYEDVLAAAPRG
jgi:hypothetical protein